MLNRPGEKGFILLKYLGNRMKIQTIFRMADRLRFELRNAFASPVFKTGAFNRSAICPLDVYNYMVFQILVKKKMAFLLKKLSV